MRAVFAIKTLSAARGGAERVLLDVVTGLNQTNIRAQILTFDSPGAAYVYPLDPSVIRHDLDIGAVDKPTGLMNGVRRFLALRSFLRQEKPDVIIGFMHSMFIPLCFAAVGIGVPVIASEHIVPQHYRTRRLEFFLLCLAGILARKITVTTAAVRDLYPRFLRSKMVVIPNPVFVPDQMPLKTIRARHVILNVGRLDPQKDHATLIAAFAVLAPAYPDWDLHIIGEGALRPVLAAHITTHGLDGRVILRGLVADISAAYAGADIFALSSVYESFGLATAEAMAHGLPCVGFADCPGTNELIVDGRTGYLAAGDNRPAAFAQALHRLMDDPALCADMGEAGRVVVAQFALPMVVGDWSRLLMSVGASPPQKVIDASP